MNELALEQCVDGQLRELALFAGAGGGILGGLLLGWRTVCAVELDGADSPPSKQPPAENPATMAREKREFASLIINALPK